MPGTGSLALNAISLGERTMIRLPRVAVWAVAIFLAVAFVAFGISKLEGASAMRWTERFLHWGYPRTLILSSECSKFSVVSVC